MMPQEIDLTRHAVIEASAGTGKTYMIEQLVLRIMTEQLVPLEQILVVTFTEKATGELKDRLRTSIDKSLAGNLPPDARQVLRKARDSFDEASIFTIHGFCHRVLRQYAFENGELFDQEVVDDNPLYLDQLRDLMRRGLGQPDPESLARLLVQSEFPQIAFGGGSEWESIITDLAARYRPAGGDVLLPRPLPPDQALQTDCALAAHIEQSLRNANELLGPMNEQEPEQSAFYIAYSRLKMNAASRRSRLEKVILPLIHFFQRYRAGEAMLLEFNELLGRCRSYTAFKEAYFNCLTDGADNFAPCPRLTELVAEMESVRAALLQRARNLKSCTVAALQKAMDHYKRERGQVSFTDMIERLDRALDADKNPAANLLLGSLKDRFRVALVDEFQDTDPIQWRIFKRLFLSDKQHQLIVVGDPKQAIYAFRNADLRAYQLAVEELQRDHDARFYRLGTNWRSMPQMIDALNTLLCAPEGQLAPWFSVSSLVPGLPCPPVSAPPNELRRSRLFADRTSRAPITVVKLPQAGRAVSVRKECLPIYARFIAAEIQRLLSRDTQGPRMVIGDERGRPVPLAPNHICILVQKKKDVPLLEKELRRHKIPHTWYKKPNLWQSDEALHVAYALKAIANPSDPAAMKKALLTRFFHIPADRGRYARISLPRLQDYEELPPAHPVRQLLSTWQQLAAERQWPRLFRSLLHDTGVLLDDIREDDGERRIANFTQIIEHLESAALSGGMAIQDVVEYIDGYRRRFVDVEEDLDIHRQETENPRVLILTMHTAKGLEFPVVFVAGGFNDSMTSSYHKYHDNDQVVYDLRDTDAGRLRSEAETESELRRVYYVACTRPMHKLYLPYHPSVTDKKGKTSYWGGAALNHVSASVDQLQLTKQAPIRCVDQHGEPAAPPLPPFASTLDPLPPAAPMDDVPEAPIALPPELFPEPVGSFHPRVLAVRSFSSLARPHAPPVLTIDDPANAKEDDEPDQRPTVAEGDLPAGRTTGDLLHAILEIIDFATAKDCASPADLLDRAGELIDEQLARFCPRVAPDTECFNSCRTACARHVLHALTTPLPQINQPLCDLAPRDRLAEVAFHLYIPPAQQGTAPVEEILNKEGYLTGRMDLIFRHEGRYYLLDWKSNLLADYSPAGLSEAMEDAGYYLQRRIYLRALGQWLQRQPSHAQLGGAFYLFLRGLATPGQGIVFSSGDANQ